MSEQQSPVFIHPTVRGVNDVLVAQGLVSWPDDKTAAEACLKVALSVEGPEILPEDGLSKDAAILFGQMLKAESDALKPSAEQAKDYATKVAALTDVNARAIEVADESMKVASNLLMHGGQAPNTPQAAAAAEQAAKLDALNRPPGAYKVSRGHTTMPQGGVLGKTMPATVVPSATAATPNELAKHASNAEMLAAIKTAAPKGKAKPDESKAPELVQGAAKGMKELHKRAAVETFMAEQKVADLDQLSPDQLMMLAQAIQSHADQDPSNDVELSSLDPEILQALSDLAGGGGGGSAPPMPPQREMSPPESKSAAALAMLSKAAMGSLTSVGKNTPESAAKSEQTAALDQKNRPSGEYEDGRGETKIPNVGHVGANTPPAKPPEATGHPDTTLTREQKKAGLSGTEADEIALVEKMALLYADRLPGALDSTAKLAHLKKLAKLAPEARPGYLQALS